MASETRIQSRSLPPADAWPPDDAEESILGTDLHQMAIMNLRWGINEVARIRATPERHVLWQALSQIMVMGCERPDGSAYTVFPDVFVYCRSIDQGRGSVAIGLDGPPALIIEVLSESTYTVDLDLNRGKGYSYARAGVREYLALDPSGVFLPEQGRAWRLEEGVYCRWEPDAAGRWQSTQIDVAIGLEGVLATVYTREGERQLREGEVAEERERTRTELARKDAELAKLHRLLDELQRQQ